MTCTFATLCHRGNEKYRLALALPNGITPGQLSHRILTTNFPSTLPSRVFYFRVCRIDMRDDNEDYLFKINIRRKESFALE